MCLLIIMAIGLIFLLECLKVLLGSGVYFERIICLLKLRSCELRKILVIFGTRVVDFYGISFVVFGI